MRSALLLFLVPLLALIAAKHLHYKQRVVRFGGSWRYSSRHG